MAIQNQAENLSYHQPPPAANVPQIHLVVKPQQFTQATIGKSMFQDMRHLLRPHRQKVVDNCEW